MITFIRAVIPGKHRTIDREVHRSLESRGKMRLDYADGGDRSAIKIFFGTIIVGMVIVCGGCRPSPDFEALRKEILDLHQQTIDAHWKKDVKFFTEHMADDYFAVKNGEILKPTREETAAEYERYLATTTFKEYRDLRQPIVGFSKDGSIAWSVVQVKVTGRDKDKSGVESDFDLTWAWITLYGRKDGHWVWLGEASNFRRAS